ncbi:MAG: substrate-binding periplasmic protein [Bacteroidales bacterium]
MKRSVLFALMLPVIVILLFQCKKKEGGYDFDLKFITENYKPLNYTEGSDLTGLAPEILREICDQLDIPYEVSVLPWEEGYLMAQNTDNAVLFSTALTGERKDLFKWAGPIASLDWMFYASSQNPITLTSLEDAKQVAKIGVLKDYAIEQYLVQQGFTNLVYCNNNIVAFEKLLQGEIDLYPSDHFTAEAALETLGESIYTVTDKLTIKTDLIYFAFNKNIPDEVVSDFQVEIDKLKTNGTLEFLYKKFMNSSDAPGILQVYTEQYPPLTFRGNNGEVTGFGTDVVREIMKRNQVYEDITLSLWSNGYELALNNPNFCLFTMDRTPIRETLFQWVGPIGVNTTWFYTKAGSGIVIASLEDAKSLNAVGTVTSWFSEQYLISLGFTNLVSDPDPKVMTEKLMNGEIDAFVCTDVTFPDILRSLGYQYSQVVPSFALMSSDYYIAFSKSTPVSTVNEWQSTLQKIKQDGTYTAIYHKWFP